MPDAQRARQPLPAFLFESRAGHCEYFATALAVLLRSQGLPTRLVNGFHGGEYNELGGFWVLRQRDAHSWVEVYIGDGDGEGAWVLLDATPSADDEARRAGLIRQLGDWLEDAWDRGVLRYDMDRQFALGLSGIAAARSVVAVAPQAPGSLGTGWLAGIGALGLLGALAFVLRRLLRFLGGARRRRPAPGVVERQWRAARRLVHRRRLAPARGPAPGGGRPLAAAPGRRCRRRAGDPGLAALPGALCRRARRPPRPRRPKRAPSLARLPRRRRAPGSG